MDTNLKQLLVKFLYQEDIVGSWGVYGIVIEPHTLKFEVEGFLFAGEIEIQIKDFQYVVLADGKHIITTTSPAILIDQLDSFVEFDKSYENNVVDWLRLKLT